MIYLWSKYFFTTRLKQRSFKILLQSTRFEHAAPSFFFFPFLIYLLMWNVFYSTSVGRAEIRQSHRELFFNLFRHLVDLGKMLALMRQKQTNAMKPNKSYGDTFCSSVDNLK